MATSSSAASLLSLLTFLLLAGAPASASVEKVCKKACRLAGAFRDGVAVDPDSCIKILGAAPGASTADDAGLAVSAGNLGAAHVQATLPMIADLLKGAGPATKGPLLYCQELYGDSLRNMKNGAAAAAGNDFFDCRQYFGVTMELARWCYDGFSDKLKPPPPLAEADRKLLLLAAVGLAVTHSGRP